MKLNKYKIISDKMCGVVFAYSKKQAEEKANNIYMKHYKEINKDKFNIIRML